VASCFVLVLLSLAPAPPLVKGIIQALPIMLLCFWVLQRPESFGVVWSFLLGLLIDVLTGQTLGIHAISFLVADIILRSQRNFLRHHSFLLGWLAASVVMAVASLVPWLVAGLVAGSFYEVVPVLLRVAFGILFFPVAVGILQRMQAPYQSTL
jgi:rod shape-determining protein MreD